MPFHYAYFINLTWPEPIPLGHLSTYLHLAILKVESPGTPESCRLDWVDNVFRRPISTTTPETVCGAHVTWLRT